MTTFVSHHVYLEEFHIMLSSNTNIQRGYLEKTGNSLWRDVKKRIVSKNYVDIQYLNIDYTYSGNMYIVIHIDKFEIIDEIITDLNHHFSDYLQTNYVPKLVSLLYSKMETDKQFFAASIYEFKDKYGKEETNHVVEVLTTDVAFLEKIIERLEVEDDF